MNNNVRLHEKENRMTTTTQPVLTLDEQRTAFCQRRFLAMPLAGVITWTSIGIGSLFLTTFHSVMLVFIATGSVIYLAMLLSKFTGENLFRGFSNPFDRLFFVSVFMALLVHAIAIPFFMKDYRSITLTVGILTGLMWMTFSWIIQHWIGYFHTLVRTVLIVAAWYLWPDHHLQVIPAIIVAIYIVTIVVLEKRWHAIKG
jgi:hypothetical protein